MISANFIHRVFRLRYGDSVGTAFTLDVDGREYLVTARHVVSKMPNGEDVTVALFGNRQWVPLSARLVGHSAGDIDISVLALPDRLTPPNLPIEVNAAGVFYGQEVFFLGFPYDFLGDFAFTERGYPLAFVKRATLSCMARELYYLDGHNNPGFSGGPVVYGEPPSWPTRVAGVISGYMSAPEPIFEGDASTGLTYRYNTGIVVAYKIDHALALIRANPIGVPI